METEEAQAVRVPAVHPPADRDRVRMIRQFLEIMWTIAAPPSDIRQCYLKDVAFLLELIDRGSRLEMVFGFCDACGANRRLARHKRQSDGHFTALCADCLQKLAEVFKDDQETLGGRFR